MKKMEVTYFDNKVEFIGNLEEENIDAITSALLIKGSCFINYLQESIVLNFAYIKKIKITEQTITK